MFVCNITGKILCIIRCILCVFCTECYALQIMEKYVKVSTIGKGTFGAVFLVQNCENKK